MAARRTSATIPLAVMLGLLGVVVAGFTRGVFDRRAPVVEAASSNPNYGVAELARSYHAKRPWVPVLERAARKPGAAPLPRILARVKVEALARRGDGWELILRDSELPEVDARFVLRADDLLARQFQSVSPGAEEELWAVVQPREVCPGALEGQPGDTGGVSGYVVRGRCVALTRVLDLP